MHRTLNIAILECDTPFDSVKDVYGTYGDIIDRLLQSGVKQLPGDLSQVKINTTNFDVVRSTDYPDPEKYDGILLSGSKSNAFDNDPWILNLMTYLQKVFQEHSTKLIGICFGHQIIARSQGAKIQRAEGGWEVSWTEIDTTKAGFKFFGKPSINVHQMHRDVVSSVPKGFTNLGSTAKCPIQGLYCPGKVLSTQFHPEYTEDIMSRLIMTRLDLGIFDQEQTDDAMAKISLDCDSDVVSTTFCRFYLDALSI